MLDLTNPDLQFAIEVVRAGSLIASSIQSEMVSLALGKADRSPVTVADYTVQALTGAFMDSRRPGETLVAEESAEELLTQQGSNLLEQAVLYVGSVLPEVNHQKLVNWISIGDGRPCKRFWVLDPIDGTKGFLRHDQYAIAFALIENGQVAVAAIGCPNLKRDVHPGLDGQGVLAVAVRGQGSWVTGINELYARKNKWVQMIVSNRADPVAARMLRSYESAHTNTRQLDVLTRQLQIQAAPVRMDSQAKQLVLAAGNGDLLLRLLSSEDRDYKEKIWDQAPGCLVIEEAGGKVTDLSGAALDFTTGRRLLNNQGVLATNNKLHETILNALDDLHVP